MTDADRIADGFEPWPGEIADPVRDATGKLLMAIMQNTAEGSRERAKAMSEALEAYERIKAAMADRRVIH